MNEDQERLARHVYEGNRMRKESDAHALASKGCGCLLFIGAFLLGLGLILGALLVK